MLKENTKAPDFTLSDEEGRPVRLSQFRGKKVILYFYPKDLTPGCTQEACDFRDSLSAFQKQNTVVLGVSADSIDLHQKFKQKHALTFPLLSDPEKKVIQAYCVWGKKQFMGKTFMGIKRTTFLIDEEGVIRRIFRDVKVNGHVQEIQQALEDLKSRVKTADKPLRGAHRRGAKESK